MDSIQLVICFDANRDFMRQIFVMLFSLLKNNQQYRIDLHCIHTAQAWEEFQISRDLMGHYVGITNVAIYHYEVDEKSIKAMGLPYYNNLPLATYFRLLIPRLLPETYTKCLYLDGDMLVRGDIGPLWNIDLGDNWVAGVMTNVLTAYMDNIGVDRYINAGMLLMNLTAWRAGNIGNQIIGFCQQYPKGLKGTQTIMGDQCGINYICRDHMLALEPKRNTTPMRFDPELLLLHKDKLGYSDQEIARAQLDPVILHFAGSRKPASWISFHPRKLEWYKYLFQFSLIQASDFFKYIRHRCTLPLRMNGEGYKILRKIAK